MKQLLRRRTKARWALPLLAALLLSLPVFAQQDIVIANSGPYFIIANNAAVGVSGVGGLNNNFIISPSPAWSGGFCLQAQNTSAGVSVAATLTISQAANPQTTIFTGNTNQWRTSARIFINLAPNGNQLYYIPVSGASRYVFGFTGSAGGGPVNIAAVQSPSGCLSGFNNGTGLSALAFNCTLATQQTVATATTVKLVATNGLAAIHICSYSVSVGGAAVAAATNLFISGTGATCGTGTSNLWALRTGTTTAQQFSMIAANGQIFQNVNGDDLCYTDAGTTAGSIVSISYAIF